MSTITPIRLYKTSDQTDPYAIVLTIGDGKSSRHVFLTDEEAQNLSNKLQSLAKSQGTGERFWIRSPRYDVA